MDKHWTSRYLNYPRHKELIQGLMDKDGLVKTTDLILGPGYQTLSRGMRPSLFLKSSPKVEVFPSDMIRGVTNQLVKNKALWQVARLRVLAAPSIVGRAQIYGVPFRRAIEEALKKGFIKSKFQVQMPERFKTLGPVAELLVHVGTHIEKGNKYINVEAWQDAGADATVFYVHALIRPDSRQFVHLDGATINFSPDDKAQLFREGKKLKGPYQKHFRVDGTLGERTYDLAKDFFPIEELAEEYFVESD